LRFRMPLILMSILLLGGSIVAYAEAGDGGNEEPNTGMDYEIIIKNNLFKPLGTNDEKRAPAFRLAGIIQGGKQPRALIEEAGKSYYVPVGQKIARGYRLAQIEDQSAKLTGPDGDLALSLNDWSSNSANISGSRRKSRGLARISK